jgi:transposase
VPDRLWDIAKPLIPEQRTRPQGGGTANTPDETLFAAIIYVLVSGCAWRALRPCFGISKSTAHRRFLRRADIKTEQTLRSRRRWVRLICLPGDRQFMHAGDRHVGSQRHILGRNSET